MKDDLLAELSSLTTGFGGGVTRFAWEERVKKMRKQTTRFKSCLKSEDYLNIE